MKKIVIVGIGGYAVEHLRSINILEKEHKLRLVAAVVWRDRYTDTRTRLENNGVTIFDTFEELIHSKADIDIISIPTGIMCHEEMINTSLRSGYDVICEKPLTGTVAEARNICKTVNETRRICAIGYQNMYSHSIESIKDMTIKKELGKLISARTLVRWPRTQSYYTRNEWAGELEFNGKKIYDSIAQNACAHFLQNMLFIAGESHHTSADIASVYGENYRAKDIHSADTQFIRVHTENNIEILFVGTHCVMEQYGPVTQYLYEHGKIVWNMGGDTLVYDDDGKEIQHFDNKGEDFKTNIFRNILESIETNKQPKCVPANAMQHTIVIENAFKSSNGVHEIPIQYRETKFLEKPFYPLVTPVRQHTNVIINGIEEACKMAFDMGKGFAELKIPWAVAGKEILL